MTDTKQCAHCGGTIERRPNQGTVSWATKKYCCRRCAALATSAHSGRPKSTEPVPKKVCAWCGKTFSRPYGMHNRAWEYRRYCCQSCAGKAHHHGARSLELPPVTELCDCGATPTAIVWVLQGSADGRLTTQRIFVCADCVEMWLEDGATLKRPPSPQGERCWEEGNAGNAYHATARMTTWHMRKGARP